jgi:DNA polymerase-3 subunit delta
MGLATDYCVKASALSAAACSLAAALALAPAADGSLILVCESLPKNTRLYRIIAEQGSVMACEAPTGRAMVSWMVRRARDRYGKRLNDAAAQRLRDHLGDAPGWVDAELAKLAAYVGERGEIALADIAEMTGHHREEKVFAVTDAMSSGDPATALTLWEQVLATDRAAPGRAVAGLAWGVRRLLETRTEWEAGADLRDLARRLYTDPDVLRRRLERVTIDRLRQQQRDLLAADLAVKTGASTIELAVEKFIIRHSRSEHAVVGLAS